jgi:hypothetical protein
MTRANCKAKCRRQAAYEGFCRAHALSILGYTVPKRVSKPKTTVTVPKPNQTVNRNLHNAPTTFITPPGILRRALKIKSLKASKPSSIRAGRRLKYVGASLAVRKVVKEIGQLVIKTLKLQATHTVYLVADPSCVALVEAGNVGSLRPIHRDVELPVEDVDTTQSPEYFTVCYALDGVTDTNGSVSWWKGSQNCRVKNKVFPVKGFPEYVITGVAGTVVAFNSRILHRSNVNHDGTVRRTLQFYVIDKDNSIDIIK